eukprot:836057-Prorocentrum_minimum.AAC.1
MDRAVEYAQKVDEVDVWSTLGKFQLTQGEVANAISSLIKANDSSTYEQVVAAAQDADCYEDLVTFLYMVRCRPNAPNLLPS